jgi:hypothetical protein
MIDVFTEEIEVLIKDGISNLYWFRSDLYKAFLRCGVEANLASTIYNKKDIEGNDITKRKMMDYLYDELRKKDFNRRLEISRNFVRILIEQKTFVPQKEKHHIEIAERSALKLKEIIRQQEKDLEYKERIQRKAQEAKKEDYHSQLLSIRDEFITTMDLEGQEKGYALEQLFPKLMRISGITVEEPFRIVGEQIDGAIKYDGHYYLIELKWVKDKVEPSDIGSFWFKVEGKFEARGIFLSMNGYSGSVTTSVVKGKQLRVILLDGNHLTNVISDLYTFQELLEHSISQATLKGIIYCQHDLSET